MVALAQPAQTSIFNGTNPSLSYAITPTVGHLLVAVLTQRQTGAAPSTPSGWTLTEHVTHTGGNTTMWHRAAPGGAVTVTISGVTNETRFRIMEFDAAGTITDTETDSGTWPGPGGAGVGVFTVGNVIVAGEAVLVGAVSAGDPGGGGHTNYTEDAFYTNVDEGSVAGGLTPESIVGLRSVAAGTYDYSPTGVTTAGGHPSFAGLLAAFTIAAPFTVDFSATPRTGTAASGETILVTFSDESHDGTGTPDTWLWDFGDGATSTLQNPTHDYPQGSYTVSLTVTTDEDETDSLTRTSYIVIVGDFTAPEPGGAILEIYAASPGAPKWDVALWDVDTWSDAAWQDVTPQGIDVDIRWGSSSPESGILTETEAATWLVNTYDPDRLLDPGNAEGPYVGDLKSGLPIRLRHLETVIRQGICETIAYYHAADRGAIRATDNVSTLARTPVPSDSVLSDTLRARARDAISAAGLALTVEPDPPAGDPALAPRLTGDRSVWRHIHDAAEQTLHIAYVDRLGVVRFRQWSAPYDRTRGVDSTQLIDLGTIVQTRGLYSVIQVRNLVGEGDDIVERALTPTPSYGKVTYLRNDATPDSDDWAAAVLADRGLQTLQWIPGDIYPLTADAVQYFATLEAIERFHVQHPQADPAVDITGIIVGGNIFVRGKKDSAALWRFGLELAQTATTPLVDDFNDPGEFLLNESEDAYLYAG